MRESHRKLKVCYWINVSFRSQLSHGHETTCTCIHCYFFLTFLLLYVKLHWLHYWPCHSDRVLLKFWHSTIRVLCKWRFLLCITKEKTLTLLSILIGGWIDGDNRVNYNTLENAVYVKYMVQYHKYLWQGKKQHKTGTTVKINN